MLAPSPFAIALLESIEFMPWGLLLGSFIAGLLIRRWWILAFSCLLTIPFLGVGLGLWEQTGDVTGVWPNEMMRFVGYSATGLVTGVLLGRLILHPRCERGQTLDGA
jgi:hypothetical protein